MFFTVNVFWGFEIIQTQNWRTNNMNRNVTKKLQNWKKILANSLWIGLIRISTNRPWVMEHTECLVENHETGSLAMFIPPPTPPQTPQTLVSPFRGEPPEKRSPIVNKFTLLICLVLSFNNRGCQANYRVPRHAAM